MKKERNKEGTDKKRQRRKLNGSRFSLQKLKSRAQNRNEFWEKFSLEMRYREIIIQPYNKKALNKQYIYMCM